MDAKGRADVLAARREDAQHALQVLAQVVRVQVGGERAAPGQVHAGVGHRDAHPVAQHQAQIDRGEQVLHEMPGHVDGVDALDVRRRLQGERAIGRADVHEHGARRPAALQEAQVRFAAGTMLLKTKGQA